MLSEAFAQDAVNLLFARAGLVADRAPALKRP
jgi:hypothetical protein